MHPIDLNETDFEQKRRHIETQLEKLYAETDQVWEDPEKVRKIFRREREIRDFIQAFKR